MKKYFIYMILSLFIVIPIAAIIVIAVMNQPKNHYESIEVTYDYSSVEKFPVSKKDIELAISGEGYFTNLDIEEIEISYKETDIAECLVEEGQFITPETALVRINGKNRNSDLTGIVKKIQNVNSGFLLEIQSKDINLIEVSVPVSEYPYIENSRLEFVYENKEYTAGFDSKNAVADDGGGTFTAYYSTDLENMIFGGRTNVILITGRISRQTYTVPQKCLYKSEEGNYYLKVLDHTENVTDIYVNLGIQSADEVEIIAQTEGEIREGMNVLANNRNILNTESMYGE